MKSSGEDKELTSYMDQMDEELSRTSIGESFEKVSGICLLHGLSWGLVTEQARSARAGDKGYKRELEKSQKRERGMMGTSAERVHASRELCPIKKPPISLIINSNISPKSDRKRMGTRHHWHIFLNLVDTKWVNEKFSVLTTFSRVLLWQTEVTLLEGRRGGNLAPWLRHQACFVAFTTWTNRTT